MVVAGDGGTSLTARSERGAAGAALGGRGERAEKADSGAPQPHIEGTFLYVIARCASGSGAISDVARRAVQGRGCGAARAGRAAGIRGLGGDTRRCHPWVRAAGGGRGLGAHARGPLGPEAADVLSLESPLGCGGRDSCSRLLPRRAAQVPTPFSEGKCQQNWKPVAGRAIEPAGTTGTALGWRPGSPLWPTAVP